MDYGDVLAKGLNKKLLAYDTYGSYQGDYIAVLAGEDGAIEIYKGCYGSCSGCDWLQANTDWDNDDVADKEIAEYCDGARPFLRIERNQVQTILDAKDMSVYFPGNTRNDYDEWSFDDLGKLIKEAVKVIE